MAPRSRFGFQVSSILRVGVFCKPVLFKSCFMFAWFSAQRDWTLSGINTLTKSFNLSLLDWKTITEGGCAEMQTSIFFGKIFKTVSGWNDYFFFPTARATVFDEWNEEKEKNWIVNAWNCLFKRKLYCPGSGHDLLSTLGVSLVCHSSSVFLVLKPHLPLKQVIDDRSFLLGNILFFLIACVLDNVSILQGRYRCWWC